MENKKKIRKDRPMHRQQDNLISLSDMAQTSQKIKIFDES
jgi:hypothetical protein